MIAEPYICVRPGYRLGTIEWFATLSDGRIGKDGSALIHQDAWVPYADFEREKLEELGDAFYQFYVNKGLFITIPFSRSSNRKEVAKYDAADLVHFGPIFDRAASESSRLLKRAEFLKAVCEKEGVEWLPKEPEFVVVGNEFDKPCSICGFAGEDMHHCVSELEKRFSAKKTAEIAAGMRWHGELEFRAALLDFLDRYLSHSPKRRKAIDELRDRFLSTPNKL